MPAQAQRKDVGAGEILHCDIKGPLDLAYNRARYALVVVDESTRMVAAKEMRTKDQVVDALKSIISSFSHHPGKKIVVSEGTSTLHSDSEAVLKSKEMLAFLASKGITARASPPHTHERNGIVERAIQTVFDTVNSLLQQADLDVKFWPIALQHAVYLRNRSPTQALGGISPIQQLTGAAVSLSNLRRFGCKVFVKVDDSARSALDPKSREGIYVGNNVLSNSYRVLVKNSTRWDVVDTIHCVFDEAQGPKTAAPAPGAPPASAAASAPGSVPAAASQPPLLAARDPLLDTFEDDEDVLVSALTLGSDGTAPRSYRAAMQCNESASWSAATKMEIDSLSANGTFEIVPDHSCSDRKLLSARWIFTKKSEADGSTRFKARLVARGDHQRAGIDFDQVYAPVVNSSTLRAMLAVATINNYELDQMDAVTAFLNAPLEEELYLRIPEGFTPQPGHVLRLKKSLYGLKQAPRYWNKMLHDWMVSQGLQQSQVDQCLYFLPGKLWVTFWVDDFLVMGSDRATTDKFKASISAHFRMRDLGPIDQFLGMTITRDRRQGTLSLRSSKKHIDDML